jgi:UDP-N-acetylglucosamine transferase subunit ALG13
LIFVTVGTQLGFDRLISTVDQWAGAMPGREVFAQVGPTAFRPRHIRYEAFIEPDECRELMRSSDAIVAHAGMGTILGALELGRPLVVMPRRAALGEHRNDHQVATARRFSDLGRVTMAEDENELSRALDALENVVPMELIGPHASDRLLGALRSFIAGSAA